MGAGSQWKIKAESRNWSIVKCREKPHFDSSWTFRPRVLTLAS
jgi:hypothetical protein